MMMPNKLFLVHWNPAEAEQLAEGLRAEGWLVEVEAEDGQRACRRILADLPLAVLIYLTRLPSHGRETAAYLRTRPGGAALPILFVGGSGKAQQKTLEAVPDARFLPPDGLAEALMDLASAG
jgi:CheY-like chemotaxis protein